MPSMLRSSTQNYQGQSFDQIEHFFDPKEKIIVFVNAPIIMVFKRFSKRGELSRVAV